MAHDAKVISIIKTDLKLDGDGTAKNPLTRIVQYWDLDGTLLAEVDPRLNVNYKELREMEKEMAEMMRASAGKTQYVVDGVAQKMESMYHHICFMLGLWP